MKVIACCDFLDDKICSSIDEIPIPENVLAVLWYALQDKQRAQRLCAAGHLGTLEYFFDYIGMDAKDVVDNHFRKANNGLDDPHFYTFFRLAKDGLVRVYIRRGFVSVIADVDEPDYDTIYTLFHVNDVFLPAFAGASRGLLITVSENTACTRSDAFYRYPPIEIPIKPAMTDTQVTSSIRIYSPDRMRYALLASSWSKYFAFIIHQVWKLPCYTIGCVSVINPWSYYNSNFEFTSNGGQLHDELKRLLETLMDGCDEFPDSRDASTNLRRMVIQPDYYPHHYSWLFAEANRAIYNGSTSLDLSWNSLLSLPPSFREQLVALLMHPKVTFINLSNNCLGFDDKVEELVLQALMGNEKLVLNIQNNFINSVHETLKQFEASGRLIISDSNNKGKFAAKNKR